MDTSLNVNDHTYYIIVQYYRYIWYGWWHMISNTPSSVSNMCDRSRLAEHQASMIAGWALHVLAVGWLFYGRERG